MNKRLFLITLLAGILTASAVAAENKKPQAAMFYSGAETLLSTYHVGPKGAEVKAGEVEFSFPANSVDKEYKIEIFKNNGYGSWKSGTDSGIAIRLSAPVEQFNKPLTMKLNYDANKWKAHMPVAYMVEADGSLSSVTPLTVKDGLATYGLIFRPALFTWVYESL